MPRNDLDGVEPGVKQGWQFQATQTISTWLHALDERGGGVHGQRQRQQGPVDQEGILGPGPSQKATIHQFPLPLCRLVLTCRFRVLLLCVLFPVPCSARNCRCGRPLDSSGHHRSLRSGRGSGAEGLHGRKRRSTGVSGTRRQSFVECASARHGFGSAGRAGQPSTGDCGGLAIVARSAACN